MELRPLTLLFGYNNSGKSALVRALPLLADSMRPDATAPLYLKSDAVRDGGFGDLVSKLGDASTLRFALEHNRGELSVEYEVTRPAGSLRQALTSVHLSSQEDGSMRLDLVPGPDMMGPHALYRLTRDGEPTSLPVQRPFIGLLPQLPFLAMDASSTRTVEAGHRTLNRLYDYSVDLRKEVLWLGSLRRHPDRSVQLRDGGPLPQLLHDGGGVAELLAVDKLAGGALLSDVSAWYERADCFKRRLNVVQSPEERFSVVLEPMDAKRAVQVNVADTGEGIAQVLPLLVAAAMARKATDGSGGPRLLAFEQPELHLHTAIHAPLAERFCELAAMDAPPHLLVETHSENFLLGVQLQVARRKLPAERVLIYWVSQGDDGASEITRIELDEEGYAHGFPDDVFDKDVELSRLLIAAREPAG